MTLPMVLPTRRRTQRIAAVATGCCIGEEELDRDRLGADL